MLRDARALALLRYLFSPPSTGETRRDASLFFFPFSLRSFLHVCVCVLLLLLLLFVLFLFLRCAQEKGKEEEDKGLKNRLTERWNVFLVRALA